MRSPGPAVPRSSPAELASPAPPRTLRARMAVDDLEHAGPSRTCSTQGDVHLADERALKVDNVKARATKRNMIYLRKATEYSDCHQELADSYLSFISRVDFFQTWVGALIMCL